MWSGDRRIETTTLERPTLGPRDVAIRVEATGICGSDIHAYLGKHRFRKPPAILGHEVAGIVSDVGPEVATVRIGERVTVMPVVSCGHCDLCRTGHPHLCRSKVVPGTEKWPGTFADVFVAPEEVTLSLPQALDAQLGALIEPIAVAVHAVRQSSSVEGKTALVIGAGPIGHLLGLAARDAGATSIVLVDPEDVAQQTGRANGFDVLAPDDLESAGLFDLTFVTANYDRSVTDALRATTPTGEVVVVSMYEGDIPVDIYKAVFDEITVRGSMIYTLDDFRAAIDLATQNAGALRHVIGPPTPLASGADAFEAIVQGRRTHLKTLLEPET